MIPDAGVTVRRTISAPPANVYKAWTEPGELTKWFGPPGYGLATAEVDLRIGGAYRFGMRKLPDGEPFYVTGQYKELAAPSRVAFTWTWEHSEDVRDSLVTIDLREVADGTEVILTHSLLPNEKEMESHKSGWSGSLEKLAATFAS